MEKSTKTEIVIYFEEIKALVSKFHPELKNVGLLTNMEVHQESEKVTLTFSKIENQKISEDNNENSINTEDQKDFLQTSLSDLERRSEISNPLFNCLKLRAGFTTIGDVVECTQEQILKIRFLGEFRLKELKTLLKSKGLKLKEEE